MREQNSPKSTKDDQVSPAAAITAIVFALLALGTMGYKIFEEHFHAPKLSVGQCVVHRSHEGEDLESWEQNKILFVVRIEEIGKKSYRVTRLTKSISQDKFWESEASESIWYVDKRKVVDCTEALSELWNQ